MNIRNFVRVPVRRLNPGKELHLRTLATWFTQAVRSTPRSDPQSSHRDAYRTARELGLSADYARMAGNAAGSRTGLPFRYALGLGVKAYRLRIFNHQWYISINGLEPHQVLRLPLRVKPRQAGLLARVAGDGWLYLDGKTWMLELPLRPDRAHLDKPATYIGLDLGLARHAVLAAPDATLFISAKLDRYQLTQWQAKRGLTRYSQRRRRRDRLVAWMRSRNGQIAAEIVQFVRRYEHPIVVMEHLSKKILKRMNAAWEIEHLSVLIEARLRLAGAMVLRVSPRQTSRTCLACGHVNQETAGVGGIFCCEACGYRANVDLVAARNLAAAGPVAQQTERPGTAPAL